MSDNLSNTEGDRFTRRDFLHLLAVGGLGAAYGAARATRDIWQPGIVHLGIDALRNPETIERTLLASTTVLERIAINDHRAEGAPEVTKNTSYRPLSEIVGEVIDTKKKSGKPVKFQRIHGYEEANYYIDRVRESIDDPENRRRDFIETGEISEKSYVLGYLPGTFTSSVMGLTHPIFPEAAVPIWESSQNTFNFSVDLVVPGSGIAKYVIDALGEESKILITDKYSEWWKYHVDEIDNAVKNYLVGIRTYVENEVAVNGKPVSAGVIFDYCLDENDGDIGASLLDTMIFLKFMARQDTTFKTFEEVKNRPELAKVNEEWYKKNILDEYGKVGNYQNLPHETFSYNGRLAYSPELANRKVDKDLHLLNQIGKPYHVWNIAFMLVGIPPSIIQGGVAWRHWEVFNEQ